jgi:hypothetical protein
MIKRHIDISSITHKIYHSGIPAVVWIMGFNNPRRWHLINPIVISADFGDIIMDIMEINLFVFFFHQIGKQKSYPCVSRSGIGDKKDVFIMGPDTFHPILRFGTRWIPYFPQKFFHATVLQLIASPFAIPRV